MFKFLFRSAMLGATALVALGVTYGPEKVRSWVRHGRQAVKEQFNEFQGMSAELRSIRQRVDELDGEIRKLKENSLHTQIDVQSLEKEVQDREQALGTLEANLQQANVLLGSEAGQFMICGVSYSRGEVEQDVQAKIELYKVQKGTLEHLRETLMAQRNALALAAENVTRGESVRSELLAKVRLLEAQLRRYEAKKVYHEAVANDFNTTEFNTGLGEARKLLADFESKLAVKNQLLDEQLKVEARSTVTGIDYNAREAQTRDLRSQLSDLFQVKAPELLVLEKR